jgi:hypothetical protein
MEDMSKLEKLLDVPIVFGLQAQGHIPTIQKMLAAGATWKEIGNKIGWCQNTAKEHYERYLQRENGNAKGKTPAADGV